MPTADIPTLDICAKIAEIDRALAQTDCKWQEMKYQPIIVMIRYAGRGTVPSGICRSHSESGDRPM